MTRLERAGEKMARAREKYAESRGPVRALALEAIASGRGPGEVATEAGVSRMTVWTWCREAGVQPDTARTRRVEVKQQGA